MTYADILRGPGLLAQAARLDPVRAADLATTDVERWTSGWRTWTAPQSPAQCSECFASRRQCRDVCPEGTV
jgi:hypothetical protein